MSSVITSFVIASLLVLPASTLAGQRSVPVAPSSSQTAPPAALYFPDRFDWQHKKPEEVGMDAARLDDAVKQAVASENPATKEMTLFLATTFGASEPFDTPIRDVNDYARDYMPPGVDLFEAPHNQTIKWDHLLRQTSDWQGTIWGKPDWADRPEGEKPSEWPNRKLWEPGTHYKYNDARVNVLALAALHVWRRPLQDVLREEVMEPIGASSTWRWYGYDNSWVEIDGQKIQRSE